MTRLRERFWWYAGRGFLGLSRKVSGFLGRRWVSACKDLDKANGL